MIPTANRSPWQSRHDFRERMLTCTCRGRTCGACLIAIRLFVNLKADIAGTAGSRRRREKPARTFWL